MINDTPVLLSISMLTSGKKDMKKSLECLLYFKKSLPCEIILVDTGCNEEQRRLIEGYGDKIIDFTWCNDFAAARNAGLSEARGKWFMYLDDDEWFDDPQEIIAFFSTGEYKNYRSATYIQRNYLDTGGERYVDNYVARMMELEPETRFEGIIHEYLTPFREPRKIFTDFVHHYGYVYENEADKEAHARRNIEPLLEMRKNYPGEPRWIVQLAQEYFTLDDYERIVEVCRTGLEECRLKGKDGIKFVTAFYGAIYAFLLISLECMENFGEEEIWLKKAMTHPMTKLEGMAPTTAYYCFIGARLYCFMKRYEISRNYLRRYLDYAYKLKDDREAIQRGAVSVTESVFQPHTVNGILTCLESLIRLEDYAFAEEAFYLLDWTDKRLLHQDIWERNIVDACCSVAYHSLWVRMLQTLVSREEGMKEMLVVFLEREIAYKAAGDEKKLFQLYRLVAELDYEHRYILCTRILWEDIREKKAQDDSDDCREKLENLFRQLFEKYPEGILNTRDEVWAVAERHGIPMEPLLLQMDMGQWKQTMERWLEEIAPADIQQWENRMGRWKTRENVRYDLFSVKCLEGYLRCREVCAEPARLENLLWEYAEDAIDNGALLSRQEVRLAEQLQELRQHREQGNDHMTLESVKKCLEVYPALDSAILTYAEILRNEVAQRSREADEEQTEFNRLVVSLKAVARQQIENKNYSQAEEILLQVQKCVPEDEEVKELLGQIMGHEL